MFWNLPSKSVKWNEETYISGLHVINLDCRRLEDCSGCPFILQMDKRRPKVTQQLCSRAGSIRGSVSWLSSMITHSGVLLGHTIRKQQPRVKTLQTPGLLLPRELWHFLAFLVWVLLRIHIHSMSVLYSKLCLWFDEVKLSLKLVFMFVNIPLPSERCGSCYAVGYLLG